MADAYVFLTSFFKLYPEFASNPFYISGESYVVLCVLTLALNLWYPSYGGHYVPQIAWTVLNGNKVSASVAPELCSL